MLIRIKVLAVIIFLTGAVTALISGSPGKEGDNSPLVTGSQDLAYLPETAASNEQAVYTLDKVSAAAKGKAHNFTWNDGSKTVSFAEYTKGKVVLLNFWGTWCGPCKRELQDIIEVANDLRGKDFVVVGIPLELDATNATKNVTAMVKSKGINYINVIDSKRDLDKAYGGLPSVPTTYIIDKNGNITESLVGSQPKQSFLKAINRVLK